MEMLREVVKHRLVISGLGSTDPVLGQKDGAGDQEDPGHQVDTIKAPILLLFFPATWDRTAWTSLTVLKAGEQPLALGLTNCFISVTFSSCVSLTSTSSLFSLSSPACLWSPVSSHLPSLQLLTFPQPLLLSSLQPPTTSPLIISSCPTYCLPTLRLRMLLPYIV